MTFDTLEKSAIDGAPVELYEFTIGPNHWRYTSGDENQVLNGLTFKREPLKRSKLEIGEEINRANLKIHLPRDNPVADLFRLYPPGAVMLVRIWRRHRGDADAVLLWHGRVLNCEFAGGEAILHSEPALTSLRRNALRRFWQRQCPHVLYSTSCKVSQSAYKISDQASAVNGTQVDVPAAAGQADGYYAGGIFSWGNPSGVVESRIILSHTGTTLTLAAPIHDLVAGDTVDISPGCDHTLSTCTGRFGNAENYGGWPYIPRKNPFGGTTLF